MILLGMPCMYGQSVLSTIHFASSASIIYLEGSPELYLINADVRFYANFKVKEKSSVRDRYEEMYSIRRSMMDKELEEEEKVSVRVPSKRAFNKEMTGWLDKKERAEVVSKGFEKTLGRVLARVMGGR
ncbi:hypothetical protein [Myroides odoratimimus]|uniref:hypothetical protein n=2 Tax=Myroides odoratimimus TaxID=76832 RepID=UPI0025787595|nr:hypothetical protein [Myroides odoratimimus]MEC4095178.1 hypothetical protein [Myroides odoratimimus]